MSSNEIQVGSIVRSVMYTTMIGKVIQIFPNGKVTIEVDGVQFTSEIGRWKLAPDR